MFFKKSSTQSKEQAGRLLVELRYLIAMILLIGSIGLWPGNGTYNLALSTPGTAAISFASRQAGANAPQLMIETTT